MAHVIRIPAGGHFSRNETIAPLFRNVGIPGYFSITNEIPPDFMEGGVPQRDYMLTVHEQVPRNYLRWGHLRRPSISEVLWAVGFMNSQLSGVASQLPVRFMHEPFRAYNCWKGHPEIWRQILVRRSGKGFAIETIPAKAPTRNIQLAYVIS